MAECRHLNVTPQVAQNVKRNGGSMIDGRTTRHEGYAISQRKRKRIEEAGLCQNREAESPAALEVPQTRFLL